MRSCTSDHLILKPGQLADVARIVEEGARFGTRVLKDSGLPASWSFPFGGDEANGIADGADLNRYGHQYCTGKGKF